MSTLNIGPLVNVDDAALYVSLYSKDAQGQPCENQWYWQGQLDGESAGPFPTVGAAIDDALNFYSA